MFGETFWENFKHVGGYAMITLVLLWMGNNFVNSVSETNIRQAETLKEVSETMVVLQQNDEESKENQERIIEILGRIDNNTR